MSGTLRPRIAFRYTPNTERLLSAQRSASNRALFQAGGFCKTTASRSMRRARKAPVDSAGRRGTIPSAPGQPPAAITNRLKRGIQFDVNRTTGNVIVGPVRRPSKGFRKGPRLLEVGGFGVRRGQRAFIAPRPYMVPAFRKTIPRFPRLFRRSVR